MCQASGARRSPKSNSFSLGQYLDGWPQVRSLHVETLSGRSFFRFSDRWETDSVRVLADEITLTVDGSLTRNTLSQTVRHRCPTDIVIGRREVWVSARLVCVRERISFVCENLQMADCIGIGLPQFPYMPLCKCDTASETTAAVTFSREGGGGGARAERKKKKWGKRGEEDRDMYI